MNKYGLTFKMTTNGTGRLIAAEISGEAALDAANQINELCDIGSDLVFCGRLGDDRGTEGLYLVEKGDPIKVAQDFRVGSQASTYDRNAESETCRMLSAIYRLRPFKPIVVNRAAYEARFLSPIDLASAERVVRAMRDHGQGMDYYSSELPNFSDEEIAASLVRTQKLNLWWD